MFREENERMKPLVTIITATYNAASSLQATISSIRQQSYVNIEWIIVDGGSSDDTVRILQQNDDVIQFWTSEPDNGIYDAWNKGIARARGEWIGFLGAGLILHTRNRVLGLTSAATIFVVAAVGMACGAGLYVEAAISTAIVFFALRFIGLMEARSGWKHYPMLYEVRGSDQKTLFESVLAVLDRERLRLNIVERDTVGELQRVTFTLSASRARHERLLAELVASAAMDRVVSYSDEEED